MRVSEVDKAFGATFVDIEGLKFVGSLAYRKGGYLYVYLKGDNLGAENMTEEVQKETDEVFREILCLNSGDIKLKNHRANKYQFIVLNEKNVKKAFNRVHRAFKWALKPKPSANSIFLFFSSTRPSALQKALYN